MSKRLFNSISLSLSIKSIYLILESIFDFSSFLFEILSIDFLRRSYSFFLIKSSSKRDLRFSRVSIGRLLRLTFLFFLSMGSYAQTYIKLNGATSLIGIPGIGIEVPVSKIIICDLCLLEIFKLFK